MKKFLLFLALCSAALAQTIPPGVGVYNVSGTSGGGGGGSGTVTSVGVATANGVSGSVANPTTTPAITLTLGAITPSSVAATGAISGTTLTMSGIAALDGATPSSSTALIVPASTTGVSSLRIPHGAAPTSPVDGDWWSTTAGFFGRVNGSTVGPFGTGGGGSGTVTVVSSGSLTSTALVTGGGTTTLQTPAATATMDSSGNISTPGTGTFGSGASTAGAVALGQGTTQSTGTTNITLQAPASVTSYIRTLPGAVGSTGYVKETVSGSTQTESVVTSIPTTDIATGNLTIGTSGVFTAGTIELGAASDTTLARVSAGVISVEGVTVDTISATNTLTNKRISARITTITSNATPSVNTDNCDCVTITAQAAAITSMTTNLTGTPVNFDQLEFRIKDDGTARAITWGASFVAGPTALPTTTIISKALHVFFEWDAVQTKWVCLSSGSDA